MSTTQVSATAADGTQREIVTERSAPVGAWACVHMEDPASKPRFCRAGGGGQPDADILAQQHTADTGHATQFSFLAVGSVRPA